MNIANIKMLLSVTALSATIGCTKDFKELNTSPTLVTQELINPAVLFTSAIKGLVFEVPSQSLLADYAGYYRNGASGNIFQQRDWSGPYNTYFRNYIINMAEVVRLSAKDTLRINTHAMGRIAKAMAFQQLTDLYGDVPYFEAVKDVSEVILNPKYDTQEAIYTDLLKELKEAAAQLTTTKPNMGNADLLLKGNVDAWKRLANSLRLRMAMRIRYANPTLAKQHIQEVVTQPLITTNAQNAALATVNDGNVNNINAFYTKFGTSPTNMRVAFTVTDNLKRLSDPRLPIFASPGKGPAGYRGAPLQLSADQVSGNRYASDSVANMAESFLQPVYNIVVMNASEVSFLRAEAVLAGFTTENAQTHYQAGITLAMDQYKVASGLVSTYIASPAGTLTGTDEQKLEQIIVQKWLAIYYNSQEAWAEFRRTGYPRIWIGDEPGDTNGQIPRRITYPIAEELRNGANLKVAVDRLPGGNKLTSKVWWDKKAGVPFTHPRQGMFPPETN